MNKTVGLIAGTSGDSLVDRLHEQEYKVVLVAGSHGEPGTDSADDVLVTDLSNSSSIVDFFKKNNVSFVIFGTGHYKAIDLLPILEDNGYVSNLDQEKFSLVKDKASFKKYIKKGGFNTPSYFEITSVDEFRKVESEIKYPCVVKSNIDLVQPAKVYCSKRMSELVFTILSKGSSVLVEEFVNGSDCTVAVSNSAGVINNYGVLYYSKAKEYNLEGFDSANANKLTPDLEIEICELSEKLVQYLCIPGLVRVDFIICEHEIHILEINAVIVTGYTGSAYPFFQESMIDISNIMATVSVQNCLEKLKSI